VPVKWAVAVATTDSCVLVPATNVAVTVVGASVMSVRVQHLLLRRRH